VPESVTCDPAVAAGGFCEPAQIPSTPNVSVGMEAFNDTPIVNGTAYPTTTVDPKAYRYRILNAANDRFWNLQWYVADPTTGTLSEVALKPAEVAAAQTDANVFPTPDLTKSPAGPDWVQIGTEGGFLPTPTVVSGHQPMTWITDPTRFDFGNADKHSLLVAPAERADVIVDFSAYRGKTLILYNDAPAAFPARQANMDYYTGAPDLRASGGAPTPLPGYGPNTRTIMQVKVSSAAPAVAWDRPNTTTDRMGDLMAAFAHHTTATTDTATGITTPPKGVFESGSDPIVVGQSAYNTAYGTKFSATGNCTLAAAGPATCDGFARIQQQGNTDPSKADKFTFNTLAGALPDPATGTATTPTATLQIPLQPKALHDEMNSANFDEWGRMTANLGLEAPGATPLLQNIILYPYVNPPTENLDATDLPSSLNVTPISSAADGTQIWKITHNGVDTHPIHFHLYDVQVINRVTWDNIIMPPDPNELGWKDTVRLSPLEDTYVAVRPIVPTIPFGVPNSKRLLNPMMPEHAKGNINGPNGTEAGFNNTDVNGNPVDAISNEMTDFGWEYVYHCHILSHEEMDMMRPVTVVVPSTAPDSPGPLTVTRPAINLHWTDGTPVDYTDPTTWHNLKAEIGYRIQRAPETSAGVQPADDQFVTIANGLANSTSYNDTPPDPSVTYWYKVTAYNQGGDSPSAYLRVGGVPQAPSALTATVQLDATAPVGATVALAWVNNATNADSVIVERSVNGGAFSLLTTLPGTSASYTDTPALPGAYSYRVAAVNTVGTSAYAGPASVTVAKPASSTVLSSSANPSVGHTSVTFTATVTPVLATAKPTGSVSFTIDAGAPTVVPLDTTTGTAALVAPSLAAGNHTITASYSGDVIFQGSTAVPLIEQVTGTDTTTVVTSSLNPSQYGQSVTFTATVSPATGTTVPTGLVQFSIDGTAVTGTVALDGSGKAAYTTNALTVPSHQIAATYLGAAGFFASTSASITQNVTKAPSAITVTTSGSPSVFGQSVTFTARVTPAGTNPQGVTGFVQFTIDGVGGAANLKPVNAVTGVATLTTTTLAVGNHTVTAQYTGDGNFTSSTVASVAHRVRRASTRVTVVSSANPAARGAAVTFTATVSAVAPGGGIPTGTVRFRIDGRNVGAQVTIVGGVATFTTSTLGRGRHQIQVVYNGSVSYLTSTSATLRQRIL